MISLIDNKTNKPVISEDGSEMVFKNNDQKFNEYLADKCFEMNNYKSSGQFWVNKNYK